MQWRQGADFWTLGKDKEIAVYSKAGEMWNWRTSEKGVFTLRKSWTASCAVIYSVILIVLLLLLTGGGEGQEGKRKLVNVDTAVSSLGGCTQLL